ncbi:MAG: YjbQ family protein [Desulfofustis sp.]|jgi:thiamine phosphate synthase YjbQ (UPF0047 family)
MKSYRQELWFEIPSRRGFVNITPQVQNCLKESGVSQGLALINAKHITAGRVNILRQTVRRGVPDYPRAPIFL